MAPAELNASARPEISSRLISLLCWQQHVYT
jgi:hypothetical protein